MKKTTLGLAAALLAACPFTTQAQAPATPTTTVPAAAPATTAPDAKTATLRFKWTPGQTLRYKLLLDTKGQLSMGQGRPAFPMNQHMEMVMHQNVKDVNATTGAATIDTGLDSMTMTMNGAERPLPADQLAKMKNLATMVMTPTGKVLSTKMNGQTPGGGMMPGMNMTQNNMLGSGSLGQLPDKAVGIGDTWKSALVAGMPGLQFASDFIVKGLTTTPDKTTVGIDQTTNGTINMGGPQPPAPAQPPTDGQAGVATPTPTPTRSMLPPGMQISGKMYGKTHIDFDATAGAIADSLGTMLIDAGMVAPAGGAAPTNPMAGFKIQLKIDSNMTRISDKDAAADTATPTPAPPATPAAP